MQVMELKTDLVSFVDLKLSKGAFDVKGIKSIKYGDSKEPVRVECNNAQDLGITRGKYKATLSVEFAAREYYQAFLESLGDGPYDVLIESFTISFSVTETSPVITDRIFNFKLKKGDISASGADAVAANCDFEVIGGITWNGIKPIKNMKGVS